MKTHFAVLAVLSLPFTAGAQLVSLSSHQDVAYNMGKQILGSSLALPEEQENYFWSLYTDYINERKESNSGRMPMEASAIDDHSNRQPVSASNLLFFYDNANKEAELKLKYFEKIKASFNGSIALQFLQSEALIELIQRSQRYEKDWLMPSWNSAIMHDEKNKVLLVESMLALHPADTADFRTLYDDFNFAYSRVVGHKYFFFEQYVDNVAFLTPGQSYKLGKEFLRMEENEALVRKEYFEKFAQRFNVDFAARLMLMDDYFCILEKLMTWSQSPLINTDE